jgi:flagellar motor protein MotB
MRLRSFPAIISLAALLLSGGCTTKYQELLRDRDTQIRELNGRVAAMRAEKEDLERQLAGRQAAPQPVAADATFKPSELQNELGAEANVSYHNGRLSIGVEDAVTFDSGSDKLKDTAHRILKKIVGVLDRDFRDCKIYGEGPTDNDPIQKTKDRFSSNRHLSVMRADAVARYLIEQGLSEQRIVIVGYGQFDPKDPRVKERNRRVEIVPVRPGRP